MLTPEQISAIRDQATSLTDPVNAFILQDIARRVSEAGQLTSTAAYQVWRAQQMGTSQRELKKQLRKLLQVSRRDLRRLLTQSAEVGYDFDIKRLPMVQAVPFRQNDALQRIVQAAVELAGADFDNLTQTLGLLDPQGQALPLREAYTSAMDYAFKLVSTGATDYNTAIRRATKNLAEKGLLSIEYASGIHTSLEAAVRRSLMGGLGLMVEQTQQVTHDQLGCDGWEISAHANSAPDHEPIQGKQYADAEYQALNSHLARRIGTLNCGHIAFPIILGVSAPQYTPEELERFRTENEQSITYQGRHYTGYEATQLQRRLERRIREQKRRVLVSEAAGDKEKLTVDQIRLRRLTDEYKRFSKAAGLRTQEERLVQWTKARKRIESPPAGAKAPQPSVAVFTAEPGHYVEVPLDKWYPDAIPESHRVVDLQSVTVGGVTYRVNGHTVKLKYSEKERETAELLRRTVGGEIFMVPKVEYPQGVRTPDFLFNGKAYDLKGILPGAKKDTVFRRIKNGKGQAASFIIDVTGSGLDEPAVIEQIKRVFRDKQTDFVDEVVIIRDGKIISINKRA